MIVDGDQIGRTLEGNLSGESKQIAVGSKVFDILLSLIERIHALPNLLLQLVVGESKGHWWLLWALDPGWSEKPRGAPPGFRSCAGGRL